MKKQLALLLILSLAFSSCIGRVFMDRSDSFKLSKSDFSFMQEYECPENLQLTLSTCGGNIEVSGYEGNRVKVAFVVTKNNGDVVEMTLDELQKYASYTITKQGHKLSIVVDEIYKQNMSVGFRVQTPMLTACDISTSGGNLYVADLTGNQRMETSGGNVHLKNLKGVLNAQTSGGNIHLEGLTGPTKVATSGGNIDAKSVEGDLTAETSGGNINLENHLGKTDVATSGGNIHLENLSGSISAKTSGGNVHVRSIGLAQNLFLETDGGYIDCELPDGLGLDLELSGNDIRADLSHFLGEKSPERVSGKINGGGIPVRMNCPGGSLRLSFGKSSDNQ